MGEGAGILILEAEDHARARGAAVLAEIVGYASVCDAYSMLQPDPAATQAARLMTEVMRAADLSPAGIDYLNAHATATPTGDAAEAAAVRAAFGARAETLPVSATKSITGHAIAGSGAMEAVACVLALREGRIPPTANLDDVDPDCALHHVVGKPLERAIRTAMSTSFGFGGHNAALVFQAS